MEHLSTDSEYDSAQEHNVKHVIQTSKTINSLPQDADRTRDDQYDSGSYSINHDSTDQGDDNVGKSIEGIKQIEFCLSECFGFVGFEVVFLDRAL